MIRARSALLLVGWLALAGGGCHRAKAQVAEQAPAGEVWLTPEQVAGNTIKITPVRTQPIGTVIAAGGKVTFDDLRVAHVFSPVTGRITRILAQPGQHVKKGDPLARITAPEVGTAFADVVKAQADLIAAEHDYKRQKELFDAHAAARKDLEVSEDNFRKAKAEFLRAQQKTRLLRSGSIDRVTQEYTLRAPIDGQVVARSNVNPGTEVAGQYAGGNAVELFTIGELDVVWVLADVFEIDLPRVKPGAAVGVKVVAYPDRVFTGKVDWISDSLDPASRTAKVRCAIPNPKLELRPEMYAHVSISVPGTSALAVPRDAVLRLGEKTMVFVEAGRTPSGQLRFQRRPVTVAQEEGGALLPVTHGLTEGERVVTSGAILLVGVI